MTVTTTPLSVRQRLKATLLETTPATFPDDLRWILDLRQHIHSIEKGAAPIGELPIALQHLLVLVLSMESEFQSECHRRCVAWLGTEKYDNERVEFGIHTEVTADPQFNQAPKVWNMLERRVRRVWQKALNTADGHEIVYFIDVTFMVYETRYQRATTEEKDRELEDWFNSLP